MRPNPDVSSQNQPFGNGEYRPAFNVPPQQGPLPRRRKVPLWVWIVIACVVPILLIVGGVLALFSFLNNSPAKATVQQYYTAVEKQDYTKAYSYLDIQTMSANGQQYPATQALYIQESQATDQAKGKVTAYTVVGIEISSTSATGNTASITVNVTRGGTVQQVHIQLQEVNNSWKIVSIDHL